VSDRAPSLLPALSAIPWLRYAVTTRDAALPLGGDMSFSTGAACPSGVIANRERWLGTIGRTCDDAVMSGLVHGTTVRLVDRTDAGRGVATPATAIVQTDGLMTSESGLTLMMCFADCVPLVVVDTDQRIIALAHAGWRGTLAGMAGHVIAAMRDAYGCHPASLMAVIGPSIGPRVYDVGPEVVRAFRCAYPGETLIADDDTRVRLDLWRANRSQFVRAGLAAAAVHVSGICTFERGHRFFSHRYALRHHEAEGRFAVLVSVEG